MRILAFSDLHRDLDASAELVNRSANFDLVIGAGDFASQHRGLEETIAALREIETPTVLVPGNNETLEALTESCAGWEAARILHGSATEIDGVSFYGLGAGIPITPWDWSYDLSEEAATALLESCPEEAVMVLHSPPYGHCDQSSAGESLGSRAIAAAIESKRPPLAVCGHIHESWGVRSRLGDAEIVNLGPGGAELEV
jgi:uncharacterized protein